MSTIEGKTPAEVLEMLGGKIDIDFSSQVQDRLDVDVVQIGLKANGSCLCLGSRPVIVAPRTDNWFRQVFGIAHELGHIAQGAMIKNDDEIKEQEDGANLFAADLLMPEAQIHSLVEGKVEPVKFARFIWDWGISVPALSTRLEDFKLPVPEFLHQDGKTVYTQNFLGEHLEEIGLTWADLQRRASLSGAQRFPTELLNNLYEQVIKGNVPVDTYKWTLGIQITDNLVEEVPEESDKDLSADEILKLLEL